MMITIINNDWEIRLELALINSSFHCYYQNLPYIAIVVITNQSPDRSRFIPSSACHLPQLITKYAMYFALHILSDLRAQEEHKGVESITRQLNIWSI